MQAGSMGGGGGRYARPGSPARSTPQVNQLGVQINMLKPRTSQYTMTFNELNNEIKQLSSKPQTQAQTQPKAKTKADDLSKSEAEKFLHIADRKKRPMSRHSASSASTSMTRTRSMPPSPRTPTSRPGSRP